MSRKVLRALPLAWLAFGCGPGAAADGSEIRELRREIDALRQSYEARIQALEARLRKAEAAVETLPPPTPAAAPVMQPPAAPSAASASAFNPAISLILSGRYASLSQDPANYRIAGFVPGGESGPGQRGFSLAESELVVSANIDPYFYGFLTLAVDPDDSVSTEEAFVQTLGLGHGLTFRAGRFFSGIGYLNEQHAHSWDFVDNPLAYQAFLGTQFGDDGVRLKWLLPTPLFAELGVELGRGRNFPGSDRDGNGAGAGAAYLHVGGDVGASHSWRAGVSYLRAAPRQREFEDALSDGTEVSNSFSGTSRLWIADFVWKWAPEGNPAQRNFKLQGEYLRRREDGTLFSSASRVEDAYASRQSGWYLQAVWQFMPYWRVGLRGDRLDGGRVDAASNGEFLTRTGFDPSRQSLMVDYNPSEFSRIRLQFSRDKAQEGVTDNQLFLQYQMSLGAHGAHGF